MGRREADVARLTHRLRSLAALLALFALLVGVPMLLTLVAGWPLPRRAPDWSRISTAVQQGDIPGETVIKVLAVLVWIAWAQLAWAIVWELVVNVPRSNRGQRAQPAPLVPTGLGRGIGRLVALALSIGITLASTPTPSLARPAAAVAMAPRAPSASTIVLDASGPGNATAVEQVRSWRVVDGDNLWDIAVVALGDGSRSSEIIDLNWQLRSPRDVRAGQLLRLPADAAVPADRVPSSASPEGLLDHVDSYLAPTVVTIEQGDTLWDLSEDRLEVATGEPVSGRETFEYLDEVIAANPDTIEDPNLIFPGEQFMFPEIGEAPASTAPAPESTPAPEPSPPESQTAPTASPTVAPETPPSVPVTTTVVPAAAVPSTSAPATTPVSETPIVLSSDSDGAAAEGGSAVPWLAGLTGATVLSAGALAAYRRQQRRRAARGERPLRRDAAVRTEAERHLVRVGDVSFVRWANLELAELARSLVPTDVRGTPIAVEMSADHGLELLWDEPNPVAPRPWEAADGGWSWRLIYDADLHLPATPETAPIPGLVTFGTRDGGTLLVNLEALGSLAVTGDATAVDAFVRSLVIELSLSEELANSYLFLVDSDLEVDSGTGRASSASEGDAVSRITSVVDQHAEILRAASLESSFGLRLSGAADGRELNVVVAAADQLEHADLLSAEACPNRGVAVVLAGDVPARATLVVNADGSALLSPLGLRFQAAALEAAPAEALISLLHGSEIIDDDSVDGDEEDGVDEARTLDDEALDDDLGEDDEWEPPVPEVLVRVLGPPRVDGHPNLGRLDVSLVAFLACKGGQATEDQVVNAVWGGRAIEKVTLWNRISKARVSLGAALPAREQGSSVVRLAPGVITDLHLLNALAARAEEVSTGEAIDLLLEATSLIGGVPFDAAGYDWSYDHQFNADACEAVESVCVRLAELALQNGDPAAARHAISSGLKALPLNEPLYRLRMRTEADVGNRSGIRAALAELRCRLSDLGDECEPTRATQALFEQLLGDLGEQRTA
jgi:nucleoid-associated protein YgaU